MPAEGSDIPQDKPKESRDELLKELEEINIFLEKWGNLYNQLTEKGDSLSKEAKHLVETGVEDDVDLEMFSQIIGEGRNIESIRSEYIQKINRKIEIEERLRLMGESN